MRKKTNISGIFSALCLLTLHAGATVVYSVDFGDGSFTDGAVTGQNGWDAQSPGWNIVGGNTLTGTGNWQRAISSGSFRAEVGETITISLTDVSISRPASAPSSTEYGVITRIGVTTTAVNAGASGVPQLSSELSWASDGTVSLGGASLSGYTPGDLFDLTVSFERTASATWSYSSSLTSGATTSTGSAVGFDLPNSITEGGIGQWLAADSGNEVKLAFGNRNTSTETVLGIGAASVSIIPEPTSTLLGLLGVVFLGFYRRR